MKENDNNSGAVLAISAGVAALAAGAYYFFGPDAKKHQKSMKGWMVKMKGEIIEKLEVAQDVTEPVYNAIVDRVADKYLGTGTVAREEVNELVLKLKEQWKNISGQAKQKRSAARNSAKRAVARVPSAKQIAKKVVSARKDPAPKQTAKKSKS